MSATQSSIDATHVILLHMPEVLENILNFLPTKTIYKIQRICSQWKAVVTALPPPYTKPVMAAAASLVIVQVNPNLLCEQTTSHETCLHDFNLGILRDENESKLTMLVTRPPSTEIHLRLSWYESSGWYFRVSNANGFRVRDLCEAIHDDSRQMYRSAEGLICAHLKVLGVMGPGGTTIRKDFELRLAEK
ncbi:hypothetical protein EJ03DRAFT_331275 [Teratosphaeria nubilosa]|uniref:F-box domain-containing protein n=1 Tax=Teratosphaeria nubilosa TaxID=161662 RepID=A0A6G1KWS1_9PEZI|nr:hypothetical protein EJ03DRAFT_331275 [Teratosphaeria nubilosa]